MTLPEFVAARLDEDEAAANAAASVAGPDWHHSHAVTASGATTIIFAGQDDDAEIADTLHRDDEEVAPFIARHDPDRVLREVAAKRAILAEHEITDRTPEGWTGVGYGCIVCHEDDGCTAPRGYCTTLRALGAIWAGHPDYDPAWALPADADH